MNELVHEEGHAIHFVAVRARPAFAYNDSILFIEAFADVPSWSVYEPAWQQKYLGTSSRNRHHYAIFTRASCSTLRGHYLKSECFTIRRQIRTQCGRKLPAAILHIVPHPEYSWWAVRVQLMDSPGYMVNYGLGAVITADVQAAHPASRLGRLSRRSRWYGWISEHLLRSGGELPKRRNCWSSSSAGRCRRKR